MTAQTPPPGADSHKEAGSADAAQSQPDAIALSPAIGPLPTIYVPRALGKSGPIGPLWHVTARAARRWATRHLRHRHVPHRHHATGMVSLGSRQPYASAVRGVSIGGTVSDIRADLRYSRDHLWVRLDAGTSLVRTGVTDFAQQSLGDVVDVTLPGPGEAITAGEACGDIESTKSVSDLIAPITGTVHARNDALAGTPELVNTDPYGQGWMFDAEIDPSTVSQQLASLMDARAYRDLAGE